MQHLSTPLHGELFFLERTLHLFRKIIHHADLLWLTHNLSPM